MLLLNSTILSLRWLCSCQLHFLAKELLAEDNIMNGHHLDGAAQTPLPFNRPLVLLTYTCLPLVRSYSPAIYIYSLTTQHLIALQDVAQCIASGQDKRKCVKEEHNNNIILCLVSTFRIITHTYTLI